MSQLGPAGTSRLKPIGTPPPVTKKRRCFQGLKQHKDRRDDWALRAGWGSLQICDRRHAQARTSPTETARLSGPVKYRLEGEGLVSDVLLETNQGGGARPLNGLKWWIVTGRIHRMISSLLVGIA